MTNAILFWLAKPLTELLFVLLFAILVAAAAVIFTIPSAFRQARCKHAGRVRETSACDAICADCDKNLGFIGAWRDANSTNKQKGTS